MRWSAVARPALAARVGRPIVRGVAAATSGATGQNDTAATTGTRPQAAALAHAGVAIPPDPDAMTMPRLPLGAAVPVALAYARPPLTAGTTVAVRDPRATRARLIGLGAARDRQRATTTGMRHHGVAAVPACAAGQRLAAERVVDCGTMKCHPVGGARMAATHADAARAVVLVWTRATRVDYAVVSCKMTLSTRQMTKRRVDSVSAARW